MTKKKELIVNPLLAEKESELLLLQRKYQLLLKKLETEKSKVQQLKDDMISFQRQAFSTISAKMETMRQLQQELKKLLQEAASSKLFTKQEKKILRQMAKDMDDEAPQHKPDPFEKEHTQNRQEYRSADYFSDFIVTPAPEEGQHLRKIYLKLATRFHPDKARNEQESRQLHTLMQRINEAYKAGDMAELLLIEAQYLSNEPVETIDSVTQINLLQQRINRLAADIEVLQYQLQRVKKEGNGISRSDAGKMHKQMKKHGSPLDCMTQDLDQAIAGLSSLRDSLQIFLSTGIMPASLVHELHPEPYDEPDLDEMLQIILEMQEEEDRRRRAKKKTAEKKKSR